MLRSSPNRPPPWHGGGRESTELYSTWSAIIPGTLAPRFTITPLPQRPPGEPRTHDGGVSAAGRRDEDRALQPGPRRAVRLGREGSANQQGGLPAQGVPQRGGVHLQ